MRIPDDKIARRRVLGWLAGPAVIGAAFGSAACAQNAALYEMKVSRDVGCGCCHLWAETVRRSGKFRVALTDAQDMPALKRQLGVPSGLGSCHTGVVEGYVIEGHVPVEDILRLLEEQPAGIRGLAVPGMPRGSPGMEQPDRTRDPYEVLAFRASGKTDVFARHGGKS